MKKINTLISGIALLTVTLAFTGCPKSTQVASSPENQQQQAGSTTAAAPASTAKNESASNADNSASNQEKSAERAGAASSGLQAVYFNYNESVLTSDARSALKADAEWLKANPKATIRIEGNCDERGTNEYNQALGQRRAASAKKFLTNMGIRANRMSLISYGKEKPVCTDSNDACWQKNRRDDLAVRAE